MTVIKIVPMPGPQGEPGGGGTASIADFVFTNVDSNNSSMTITGDKEMTIESGADSDLNLHAGDDVWITSGDDIFLQAEDIFLQADDDIQFRSQDSTQIMTNFVDNGSAEHIWEFTNTGSLIFPDATIQNTAYTGGAGGDTGDITFVNTTISTDSEDDIVIENKNDDGIVKARITLDQGNEQVLIEAMSTDSEWFDDSQWDTATWSGNTVTINNTPDIINFFDTLNGDMTSVSINDGSPVEYDGAGYGSGNIGINVIGTPSEDPLTVTTIRFYYSQSSKIDINNDENEFNIISRNMSINIDSSEDINLNARDDIDFTANWDTDGTAYEWRMTSTGRFELPGAGYISNPDNSSGDGYGNDTLHLVPDSELLNNQYHEDQYLVIDPTAPNHIHIRAGGNIDESTAELILGGEKNNVIVSDSERAVVINTRPAPVLNSYENINETTNAQFITNMPVSIEVGDTVSNEGTIHLVSSVLLDTPGPGLVTVTASEINDFLPGATYTFSHEEPWTNFWGFSDTGYLYGPAMGGLYVSGIVNGENDLWLSSSNNIVLSAEDGEFLGDPSIANNQIATIGDLPTGATGSFISQDGKTITVANGIITGIEVIP